MIGLPHRFIRVLQLSFTAYLCVAVVYATYHFAKLPWNDGIRSFPSTLRDSRWSSLKLPQSLDFMGSYKSSSTVGELPTDSNIKAGLLGDTFYWDTSKVALDLGMGHQGRVSMDEQLFLSKAFGVAMGPSRIIPFYYKATSEVDQEDITITTLITSNRFSVFARLVEHYQGPVSVTIHIKNETEHIRELLDSLHGLYTSSPSMSAHVDVHLVIDNFERQFNMWRNVARLFARTDYIMMLDVDFALCTDFRRAIRSSEQVVGKLKDGNAAFVIPAFEYTNASDGTDSSTFPRDKDSLLPLVGSKRIGMFHASWGPGHNSTDYPKYYTSKPGEVYKVTQYQSAYEPYVVFKKEGPPWCDERFIGYGANKAACLFEMYISGVSFYVLSDHFIIHQNHDYEETARKNERRYNRKIYADFKEEACLRYIRMYRSQGLLNTTLAYNVQTECPKIKNVARLFGQLGET
ncbi:hypothetical protein CCMSSC00406_0003724 [Pleurotus cornucopiae]|uniref:Uncharacterized protein n=1 Tax=Pleurotus cornucopiae TaxID=5321 RepID=A0ACB7IR89_PLECO|nr:hypothetical protein CCMSSC00406_0003724 [Pleurotus cornucopiae]